VSRLQFVIGEAPVDVLMANLLNFENGGWFQKGIRLTMSVSAERIEDAIAIVDTTSDLIVPLLAVSAAAETPKVQIEEIYTDDPELSRGEVARFVEVGLPETKMRKVYLNHLEPLYLGLAAGDQRLAERVMRTLWWYHRALDEEDPVNRFSLHWTALESLNPLLTEFWHLKPNRRSCPHCSADLGNMHGVYGIDKLLREIPETTEKLFGRARDLRNAIVHGTKRPAAMRVEARTLLVPIEAAIPRGIARLLSLPQSTEDSLARAVIPQKPYYSASVRVMFTRAGREELGLPGFYPHVELSVKTHTRFDEHLEPKDSVSTVTSLCGAPKHSFQRSSA
jgi:hypothetical protein